MKFTHQQDGFVDEHFLIAEVYYDEADKPLFYSDSAKMLWYDDEDPRGIFDKMQLAFDKPVLTPEDFPIEKDEDATNT
jgi:hypothetical protein